jgi:hypothetical protein
MLSAAAGAFTVDETARASGLYAYTKDTQVCVGVYGMGMDELEGALRASIRELEGIAMDAASLQFGDLQTSASPNHLAPAGLTIRCAYLKWNPDKSRIPNESGELRRVLQSPLLITIGRPINENGRSFVVLSRGWNWVGQARIPTTDIHLWFNQKKESLQILDTDINFLIKLSGKHPGVVLKQVPLSFLNEVQLLIDGKSVWPTKMVLEAREVLEWAK